jgi:hypothetical protein
MVSGPDLEALAREHFPAPFPLSRAEEKLVRCVQNCDFAVGGSEKDEKTLKNNPEHSKDWTGDRQVRAPIIRWLCLDRDARSFVGPLGIQVFGAVIFGELDLSHISVPFGLTLRHCRLTHQANLEAADLAELDLRGSWTCRILADRLRVRGSISLRNRFTADGVVRFTGAHVEGNFNCTGGTFRNPRQQGGAALQNLSAEEKENIGVALFVDNAVINGTMLLRDEFRASGEVRLLGAQIAGNLECTDGRLENPPPDQAGVYGDAFSADGATVKGDVSLGDLSAKGDVRLVGMQIGGDLSCDHASFDGALVCERSRIAGMLYWSQVDSVVKPKLNLTDALADAFVDDVQSWPECGKLVVDGFVYRRISGKSPKDAASRLNWLARAKRFGPQPYRQLAKVMREEGDSTGAQKILFEMERRRRQETDHGWFAHARSFLFRDTVGYGYYPTTRAAGWLLGLVVVGFLLFWAGYSAGSITPTEKEAYNAFNTDPTTLPGHYERFHAVMYSVQNCFEPLHLGQSDLWQPDPAQSSVTPRGLWRLGHAGDLLISASALRFYRWLQILLGWFFAAMIVGGVADIVRKDQSRPKQHLHRYLSESDFCYDSRKITDVQRAPLTIRGSEGKRLTYRNSVTILTDGILRDGDPANETERPTLQVVRSPETVSDPQGQELERRAQGDEKEAKVGTRSIDSVT